MAENELAGAIFRFFGILHRFVSRAHVTGGLASSFYGRPRFTQDIDIVLDAKELGGNLSAFLQALSHDYLYSRESIEESLKGGRVFQCIDSATGFKFDLYPREGVPGELSRTISVELFPGIHLPIVSREDAVISKLYWIKRGSIKSREDVRAIMAETADPHSIFLRAEEMGQGDLLREVLSETEPED